MKRLARIPLFGSVNRRGYLPGSNMTLDQRISGLLPVIIENPVSNSKTLYMQKRPGFLTSAGPGGATTGDFIRVAAKSSSFLSTVKNFSAWGSTAIYYGTTYCGSASQGSGDQVIYVTETLISNVLFYLFTTMDTTLANCVGWYLDTSVTSVSLTFTGDTHTNTTIDNVSSTSGLRVGQKISGTNIVAGTRIATVGVGTITVTTATTGTTAGITVTRENIAKIIDTDFPAAFRGGFVCMDGYTFIIDKNGTVYHSDLNSITSWSAASIIQTNEDPDEGVFLVRQGHNILAFGRDSIQYFYNAGNASGSVLSRSEHLIKGMGAYCGYLTHQWCQVRDTTYWIAGGGSSMYSVISLSANGIAPVSTQPIDVSLNNSANSRLQAFSLLGEDYLYLASDPSTTTFSYLYSIRHKVWFESGWSVFFHLDQVDSALIGVTPSSSGGKIYTMETAASIFQDDSANYAWTIQIDDSGLGVSERKFIEEVHLIADTQSSGTVTLEYSDNQGSSYTTHGTTFDMTAPQKKVTRLGSYKGNRMWRVTQTANIGFRGQYLDIYGTVGNL